MKGKRRVIPKLFRIHGPLWIGAGDSVRLLAETLKTGEPNDSDIYEPGYVGILNVADDYPPYPHHRDTLYVEAGLNDGPEDWSKPYGDPNSPKAYINAIKSLDYMASFKDHVIVHCHGGVSRSCFVMAMYLSWIYGAPPVDMARILKRQYARCNIHPKHWVGNEEVIVRTMEVKAFSANTLYQWGAFPFMEELIK